jgi:mono/diheme cytochrome c family protein
VRTSDEFVVSDDEGSFRINGLEPEEPITITAWAPGYFIVAVEDVSPLAGPLTITLIEHDNEDHPDYSWVSAFSSAGEDGNCQNCHSDDLGLLPFEEWIQDAHARTLENHRFLTVYTGGDLAGNSGQPTRYAYNRDYGRVQLPPDPRKPYYGPGYKLDFPLSEGNCSACHAPAASIDSPYETDPTRVEGVATEGITCDFCHKIWDVWLDENTGLPRANMPGVLSYEFRRPGPDHQFFAGPFDDVAPGEDTYSPIQTESAYCAPCHFGVFWDTTIYNSYGEWLDSPYNERGNGRSCQDCHMPALGASRFASVEAGGLERDPTQILSHRMLGIRDEVFMREAASLRALADWHSDGIEVRVTLTNDNTGHKLPSDSPLRNLILLVRGENENGEPLDLIEGPLLPDWSGAETGKPGHYGGEPGRMYAILLEEKWTAVSPTAAYWNPVRVVDDSRLQPLQTDGSDYRFEAPEEGNVLVVVELIFRRAFAEIAEQKGWGLEDLHLHRIEIEITRP